MTKAWHTNSVMGLLILLPLAGSRGLSAQVLAHNTGMIIGRGFDLATGDVRGDCLGFDLYQVSKDSNLLDAVHKDLTTITDKSDLAKHLEAEVSGAYSFGGAGASAKAKYAQDHKVNTYAVNFVASVEVETSWDYVAVPHLTDEAKALTAAQFRTVCGNGFISGILNGGEFYGVGEVSTRSESDRQDIAASVQAAYLTFQANASFSSSLQQAQQDSRLKIDLWKRGASTQPTPATLDGITAEANTFEANVGASGGSPRLVFLQDYGVVPGYVTNQPNVPSNVLAPLQQMAALDAQFETVQQDVVYVNNHAPQFLLKPTTAAALNSISQQAVSARSALQTNASQCLQTAGQNCSTPAGLPDVGALKSQLPLRYAGVCENRDAPIAVTYVDAYSLTRGDNEMGGHNPHIVLAGTLSKEDDRYIFVNLHLNMTEDRPNWTTFEGDRKWRLFDTESDAPHCRYASTWATPNTGKIDAHGGTDNHSYVQYNGTGMIIYGTCRSDSDGSDNGDLRCKDLAFKPIKVGLEHVEGTSTPTLLESIRKAQQDTLFRSSAITRALILRRRATFDTHIATLSKNALGKGKKLQTVTPRAFKRLP